MISMTLQIEQVITKKQEHDFIMLPWKIYKNDPVWVPPLISEMQKTIHGENNTLHKSGPHTLILAQRDGEYVGRLCIGINEKLNAYKKIKQGYLSLFECIDDSTVAKAMFDYAYQWLKDRGMDHVVGPLSVPNGDDCRGLIIDNYEDSPMVMNVYNPPYYVQLFESYGFTKYLDYYGFKFDLTKGIPERYHRVVEYAQNRYKFRVDPVDLKRIDEEMKDVKKIIDISMPDEWPDFYPPTDEEIDLVGRTLKPVAVADLIYIARDENGEPIGFSICMPDYNQALKHCNGRLFPFGFLKFLWHKRHITRARIFVLFVVPAYRKKAVTAAIYLKTFETALRLGYTFGEGSTIAEANPAMCRDAEGSGGEIYKTFRIFQKPIQ